MLELGARYGTVSCTINKKLNNKKNQVSVEPDDRVWNALDVNKIKNACDFNIVKGFVTNKKLDLTNLGEGMSAYGATFIENNDTKIPSYSLDDLINIDLCKNLIQDLDWECKIFTNFSTTNFGSGIWPYKSINWAFSHVEKLLIIEDDVLIAEDFYRESINLLNQFQ